jgi:FkbM family methyltransferase
MSLLKNLFYTGLDLVTLKKGVPRKINNHVVRFPARWSRYYESNYEEQSYMFLEKKVTPGMQLIDIGAHIGLFSVTASQLTGAKGKIICFEPTPGTYTVLKETLRLNKCDNVIPVQAAVSDKEGEAVFYVSDTEACNSNSLVRNKEENEITGYPVKLVTIDSVVSAYALKPSIIKIDAEGAELDVLKGGIQTFKSIKPILILGLHPAFIKQKGDSLEAIWDLLEENKYELKLDGKVLTKSQFCSHTLLFDVHCF